MRPSRGARLDAPARRGCPPCDDDDADLDDELLVVWTAADYALYVAFSPLVSKPVAYAACHKLQRKLKKEQPQLFMMAPVFK